MARELERNRAPYPRVAPVTIAARPENGFSSTANFFSPLKKY